MIFQDHLSLKDHPTITGRIHSCALLVITSVFASVICQQLPVLKVRIADFSLLLIQNRRQSHLKRNSFRGAFSYSITTQGPKSTRKLPL